MKNSRNKRRFLRCFVFLLAIGFLLCGGYIVRGQRVFYCAYDEDVVSWSEGYVTSDQHYTYIDDADSYLLIQCMEGAKNLLLKFKEDAESDLEIAVSLQDRQSQTVNEETVVWKKDTCYIEVPLDAPDTAMMELHIQADFTVERAMFSVPFFRIKRALLLYAGVVFLAALLALVLSRSGWDHKLADASKSVWNYIRTSLQKENRMKSFPVWFSFLVILGTGSLYTFAEPAMIGFAPDEQIHYRHVAELGHPFDDGISISDYDEYIVVTSQQTPENIYTKEGRAQYGRYLNDIDRKAYEIGVFWNKPSILVRIVYLPYVLVYAAARTLHLPWTVRFILGRWSMVWVFALLCAAGIRRLKSGWLLVLMLAITPAIAFFSANYSYDTWITGWYIYGFCILFGELQRPQELLKRRNAAGILIALFLADLPKLVYFPLNAIAFFMPRTKFKDKKTYWLYKAAVILHIVLLLGMLYMNTFAGGVGTGDARGGEAVNAAAQVQLALQDPLRFLRVIGHALTDYGNPFRSVRTWGNLLGYMGRLPFGVTIMILILAAIVFSWSRKEEGRFPWWYRLGVLVVYLGTAAIILVSMYIVFTPVGADTVQGAQHRYLVPLQFPMFFVLTRLSGGRILTGKTIRIVSQSILTAIMVSLNLYAVWSLLLSRL